jgi:hypothetical protein
MAKPDLKSPSTDKGAKPVVAAAKQKAAAFVNWSVLGADGKSVLRSNRGFSLFLNEHVTLEEKALIELAEANGGEAIVHAELRIMIAKEKPEKLDISAIPVIKRNAA